jgi:predicted aconitase
MVHLTPYDQTLLEGKQGPAAQMAMRIIVRMAELQGATELLDIVGAHIDSTLYMGEATLEFAERLANMGGKVVVPTTLNVTGVDEHGWQAWATPPDHAVKARRQMMAYQQMGGIPTWTCTPYQTVHRPTFGQQIAWGESNAIVFANSVIGARTERYPDLMDICAAITGRVPALGLHLTENRAGQLLLQLRDIPVEVQADDTFYPLLGAFIGRLAGEQIPVVDGLSLQPDEEQLKALGAASASAGAVALFHIVGVTPEAPTFEAAFQGRPPVKVIEITMPLLQEMWRDFTTAEGDALDMVVLGSPHFSLAQFQQLAPLLAGKKRHPDVPFLVTSSRAMAAMAQKTGVLQPLLEFGGTVTVDTCILTTPMLPTSVQTLMTNSAKYAYYAPGMLNTRVTFGSLADCVTSAMVGRVTRTSHLWDV